MLAKFIVAFSYTYPFTGVLRVQVCGVQFTVLVVPAFHVRVDVRLSPDGGTPAAGATQAICAFSVCPTATLFSAVGGVGVKVSAQTPPALICCDSTVSVAGLGEAGHPAASEQASRVIVNTVLAGRSRPVG